ncbi:hypothetical protein [Pandoraea sp. CB10b_02]|uniref:hypothetical protein n=1 Tax=Pandoraea sp. CB10b_02 TaxID=2014535 RepID=UPI0025797DB9|nr:hypothetical protein [Pandoraea sp. CB10b_02]
MNKTIYNYHPQTGEFINEMPADESPLEPGVILLPAFATTAKPPKTAAREVAVFAGGQWQAKADWRGVALFNTTDGSPVTIGEIGKTPADVGATDKAMPSAAHSWKDGVWALDPVKVAGLLDAAKANALDRINTFAKSKRALIAGTPDDAEIAGWNNKLRIAQAIVAGTATDAEKAAFQAEITARGIKGETLDIFTQKVIKNADFFAQAVGLIDGLKRKAQDSVSAAKTPEEVAAVLDGMKAQAEAAFAQLMQSAK